MVIDRVCTHSGGRKLALEQRVHLALDSTLDLLPNTRYYWSYELLINKLINYEYIESGVEWSGVKWALERTCFGGALIRRPAHECCTRAAAHVISPSLPAMARAIRIGSLLVASRADTIRVASSPDLFPR